MRTFRYLAFALTTLLYWACNPTSGTSNALSEGGTSTGSGGDPIMALFESARARAAGVLAALKNSDFDQTVDAKIVSEFAANQQKLISDIFLSRHTWQAKPVPTETCAYTKSIAQADILFSFNQCRDESHITDLNVAAELLIHESMHHMGFTDEAHVVKFASEIYRAWRSLPGSQGPSPADGPLPQAKRMKSGVYTIPGDSTKCAYGFKFFYSPQGTLKLVRDLDYVPAAAHLSTTFPNLNECAGPGDVVYDYVCDAVGFTCKLKSSPDATDIWIATDFKLGLCAKME